MPDGKQERQVVDGGVHVRYRERYSGQRRAERSDHRGYADDDAQRREKREYEDAERLRRHDEQGGRQIDGQKTRAQREARDAEHDEVAQYAHRDKDRRVGQQFARDGGEDIRIRRFEPVGGRFEFYYAAQNVHGHQ